MKTLCAWCHGPSPDPTISHGICWWHARLWLLELRWSLMKRRWARFRDSMPRRDAVSEAVGVGFGLAVSVLAWAIMLGAAYGLGWLRPISWMWGQ